MLAYLSKYNILLVFVAVGVISILTMSYQKEKAQRYDQDGCMVDSEGRRITKGLKQCIRKGLSWETKISLIVAITIVFYFTGIQLNSRSIRVANPFFTFRG
jgi:hypothetical protein